jgi:integrase
MPRKRPSLFEVRYSATPNASAHWRVVWFEGDKRKQRWFRTEKEAKEAAANFNAERLAYGTGLSLSPTDRLRAIEGIDRLAAYDKTLTEAVDFYIEHLKLSEQSVPVSVLIAKVREEMRRRIKANEMGKGGAEQVETALRKFESAFGERLVASLTPLELKEWLASLSCGTVTRNNTRLHLHLLFKYAVDFGYCENNPIKKIEAFRARPSAEEKVAVLTAGETEKLLVAADPEIVPFLSISLFAGVRIATLERLDWKDIDFRERRIVVPAFKGKNAVRYPVDISDNLAAWLMPYLRAEGSLLAPSRGGRCVGEPSREGTRKQIVAAAKRAGISLPHNVARHTFISMHVEHFRDLAETALQANNSPNVIKSNYLHLVSKEDAARYWQIYPPTKLEVVVA